MSGVEVSVAWYDGTTRTVELTWQTAVWYRSGKPPVPRRWVLVRDPQGEFATPALRCTDLAVDPAQSLEWLVLRWQLEVTFQEVRAHLGVETPRQWSDRPIAQRRGTPSRRRPAWMPSLWCDANCGWRQRVFHCRRPALDFVQKLAEL